MRKLKLNVDELLPRLSQVVNVVNSKNSMAILGSVVFQTNANGLTVTASDSETWLTISVPNATFDEPMTFCVIASDIHRVLSNLKGKELEMTLDDESHTVECNYGKGRFTLPFESADDFPRPSMDMSDATTKEINAVNLLQAIEKTSFAIANDKLRPIMNGIHFDFFAYGMVSVATDGQKLAKHTDKTIVIVDDDTPMGFTLPKKPSNIVLGLLNGCETMIDLTFNDKCAIFKNGDFVMMTRLLEGNYPHYDRVIPVDNTIETNVNKAEIIEALKRVLPLGNESSQLVRLSFAMGQVTIFAEDVNFSKSADESVECDYASQELSIGFNGGYLMEILQSIDGENVKICMKEPSRAGLFKPSDVDENSEYVSLLMPIFV